MSQFRGVPEVHLSMLIMDALARGGLVLLKNVNVRENLGKEPPLVLAEQLCASLHRQRGDDIDD